MKKAALFIQTLCFVFSANPAHPAPNGRSIVVELKTLAPDIFPTLVAPITSDISTSVDELSDDFVSFVFKKIKNGTTLAQMWVYVGWAPSEMNTRYPFDQRPENFAYERAAWYSWQTKTHGKRMFSSEVYLYNTLSAAPYNDIVVITVGGQDYRSVKQLMGVASKIRFKGVEPLKEKPPNQASALDEHPLAPTLASPPASWKSSSPQMAPK